MRLQHYLRIFPSALILFLDLLVQTPTMFVTLQIPLELKENKSLWSSTGE